MSRVLLSLGTNLGDRRRNLRAAVRRLGLRLRVTAVSPVYETAPWGETDQPPFLNICLAAESDQTPLDLLRFLKQTETDLGRAPTYRWGPRLIDIDILAYDDAVIREATLTVPHAHLAQRAFVLAPLADIAPDWRHPLTGESVAQMMAAVDEGGVARLAEPLFNDEL